MTIFAKFGRAIIEVSEDFCGLAEADFLLGDPSKAKNLV